MQEPDSKPMEQGEPFGSTWPVTLVEAAMRLRILRHELMARSLSFLLLRAEKPRPLPEQEVAPPTAQNGHSAAAFLHSEMCQPVFVFGSSDSRTEPRLKAKKAKIRITESRQLACTVASRRFCSRHQTLKRSPRQVNSESKPSKLCAENLAPESEANEKEEDKTAEKDTAKRKKEDTPKEQAKDDDKKEPKEEVARDGTPHRKRKTREEARLLKVEPWAYPLNLSVVFLVGKDTKERKEGKPMQAATRCLLITHDFGQPSLNVLTGRRSRDRRRRAEDVRRGRHQYFDQRSQPVCLYVSMYVQTCIIILYIHMC